MVTWRSAGMIAGVIIYCLEVLPLLNDAAISKVNPE